MLETIHGMSFELTLILMLIFIGCIAILNKITGNNCSKVAEEFNKRMAKWDRDNDFDRQLARTNDDFKTINDNLHSFPGNHHSD